MTDHTAHQLTIEILDRYLAGEANPSDTAMIEMLCARDPSFAEELHAIRQTREGQPHQYEHAQHVWRLVEEKRNGRRVTPSAFSAPYPDITGGVSRIPFAGKHTSARMGRLVALGLATIVALGVVTLGLQKSSARHPATVAQQTYRTNNGQRATVTLADGSVVSMAPETRITFSEINGNRQVMMQGHAYFHVASNQAEPFTVVAEGTVTRVLGTEFDVYAYPGVVPQVAVHSGKVAVAWKGTLLHEPSTHIVSTRNILTAGQAAVFRGPRDIERRTARDADFSWVTGILVYQDAPASVVAQEVRRYYGIDIRFANPDIANRRVTITLHDQPTSELINTFALALNVHYTRDGRVVTFR